MLFQVSFALFSLLGTVLASTHGPRVHAKRSLSSNLFPSGFTYKNGFTTASCASVSGVSKVGLNDDDLNVIKVSSGFTHDVVTKNGKTAWEAFYPNGSWNPSNTPKGN